MGENSKISWCDHTFSPWVGCQKVSAGCENCYAERDMTRKPRWANAWGPPETSARVKTKTWWDPPRWHKQAFEINTRPRVFCASLCDVFEANLRVVFWQLELFHLIDMTPNLNWMLLTKRPENVLSFVPGSWHREWPEYVWMGVSVEDQATADERISKLREIPARVRFVSAEPLLGPIDLDGCDGISWVIVGGESGRLARPMHLNWVRDIRDQCQAAGVSFHFKQWGEWLLNKRIGRRRAGRLLDEREWNEFPE